jgi:hypothetical protein
MKQSQQCILTSLQSAAATHLSAPHRRSLHRAVVSNASSRRLVRGSAMLWTQHGSYLSPPAPTGLLLIMCAVLATVLVLRRRQSAKRKRDAAALESPVPVPVPSPPVSGALAPPLSAPAANAFAAASGPSAGETSEWPGILEGQAGGVGALLAAGSSPSRSDELLSAAPRPSCPGRLDAGRPPVRPLTGADGLLEVVAAPRCALASWRAMCIVRTPTVERGSISSPPYPAPHPCLLGPVPPHGV